jgi:hypothetical protein
METPQTEYKTFPIIKYCVIKFMMMLMICVCESSLFVQMYFFRWLRFKLWNFGTWDKIKCMLLMMMSLKFTELSRIDTSKLAFACIFVNGNFSFLKSSRWTCTHSKSVMRDNGKLSLKTIFYYLRRLEIVLRCAQLFIHQQPYVSEFHVFKFCRLYNSFDRFAATFYVVSYHENIPSEAPINRTIPSHQIQQFSFYSFILHNTLHLWIHSLLFRIFIFALSLLQLLPLLLVFRLVFFLGSCYGINKHILSKCFWKIIMVNEYSQ